MKKQITELMINCKKIPKDCIVILEDKTGKRCFITNENIFEKIGENANKVITGTINLKENKCTMKFRKYGKIEIHIK